MGSENSAHPRVEKGNPLSLASYYRQFIRNPARITNSFNTVVLAKYFIRGTDHGRAYRVLQFKTTEEPHVRQDLKTRL